MKPGLANLAADRLESAPSRRLEPISQDEVLRVLAHIAGTGKPSDRLRAAELLGKHMGMFREEQDGRGVTLEHLVHGRRLPAGSVTIEVVDP
jgi:hypothetical protein